MTDQIIFQIADAAASEQIEGIPEEEQHIDVYKQFVLKSSHVFDKLFIQPP